MSAAISAYNGHPDDTQPGAACFVCGRNRRLARAKSSNANVSRVQRRDRDDALVRDTPVVLVGGTTIAGAVCLSSSRDSRRANSDRYGVGDGRLHAKHIAATAGDELATACHEARGDDDERREKPPSRNTHGDHPGSPYVRMNATMSNGTGPSCYQRVARELVIVLRRRFRLP